jgi:5-methylcytosine-specific restriction protein A
MSRSVPEWIGKSDDTKVPPHVRLRVFETHWGKCHLSGRRIQPGEAWECDHVIALINGGENRESNLAPALKTAHKVKTAADVAEKSRVRRKRMKFLGIAPKSGRPMPGSKSSGFRKKMNGEVVRR